MEVPPPAQPAAAPRLVKTAIVDGEVVNLRTLGIGYRLCAIAIVYSLISMLISVVLITTRLHNIGVILFWTGQLATSCLIACGHHARALGDGQVDSPPRDATATERVDAAALGMCCWIPLLGLIPALAFCISARTIFRSHGVPLGPVGPSQSVIDSLCEGRCHTCGYDITQQAGNTCPECGGDITTDRVNPSPSPAPAPPPLSAEDISTCAARCSQVAIVGLMLGLPAIALMILGSNTAPGLLPLLWFTGLVWGMYAHDYAKSARQILAPERWSAAVIITLASFLNPVLAAPTLFQLAAQLRRAARDRISNEPAATL